MSTEEEKEADSGLAEVAKDKASLARVPVVLILDTSWSMTHTTPDQSQGGQERKKIEQLVDGLGLFKSEIEDHFLTEASVDVSVVTFGGDVEVKQEFDVIENWNPPNLDPTGSTPMCEAIGKAVQHLEERKNAIDDKGLQRKRALVWLLTDGRPDNTGGKAWDDAQSVIKKGTEDNHFFFYAVGIGEESDLQTLDDLVSAAPDSDDVATFPLEGGQFKEFFRLVSASAEAQSGEAGGGDSGDSAEEMVQEDISN